MLTWWLEFHNCLMKSAVSFSRLHLLVLSKYNIFTENEIRRVFFLSVWCLCIQFLSVPECEVCIDFQALIHMSRNAFEFIVNAFGCCLCCYCNWSSSKAQKVMSGIYVQFTSAVYKGTLCIIALFTHFIGNPVILLLPSIFQLFLIINKSICC